MSRQQISKTIFFDIETRALARDYGNSWPRFIEAGGGGISAVAMIQVESARMEYNPTKLRMTLPNIPLPSPVQGAEGTGTVSISFWDDKMPSTDLKAALEGADRVVSFNGIGFDIPCLEAFIGEELEIAEHYDIFAQIKAAGAGMRGNGLGKVAERTLGLDKTGEATFAPELAASGRYAELWEYCLADTILTKMLYEEILAGRGLETSSGPIDLELEI